MARSEGAVPDDLTELPILTESTILQSICDRYENDRIYTYCSKVLIAMNPWKQLHIYTDRHSLAYQGARMKDMPPHCFAIADCAYRSMISDQSDQSILVSGESGAGKTETAKFLLQHLASLSNHAAAVAPPLSTSFATSTCLLACMNSLPTDDAHSLEQRILASNPILEAFGNARTVRNPNSSRYGKFIQLLFDNPPQPTASSADATPPHMLPRLVGASIEIFLLERSRVVHVAPGEGNYHIFGQLRSAAADARAGGATAAGGGALGVLLAERVAIEGVRILGEAGAVGGALRGEDVTGFERTVAAMRGVGLGEAEVAGALETVAVSLVRCAAVLSGYEHRRRGEPLAPGGGGVGSLSHTAVLSRYDRVSLGAVLVRADLSGAAAAQAFGCRGRDATNKAAATCRLGPGALPEMSADKSATPAHPRRRGLR